ncbi:MAG: hypothetical protein ACI814_003848 [Mariniblastus sp.]
MEGQGDVCYVLGKVCWCCWFVTRRRLLANR